MTGVRIEVARKVVAAARSGSPQLVIADFRIGLAHGEFACLVGPSGCGKSTLLNIVAGLDGNFEGAVDFGSDTERPRIGYVFQNPRLLPWRTVRENIDLAVPHELADERLVDHLLAAMGLTAVQHQYPERLSLGMSRRVAIVRAFAIQPTLLLMDEPFVSLDGPTARRVRQLLIRVWQDRPHTVLFVTHDLREAITLADRLVFLSPSPMRVIAEIDIEVPRYKRDQEAAIEAFRLKLVDGFPALRGLL